MRVPLLHILCILIIPAVLVPGCTESPVKDPVVTVGEIALSDVTLQTMKVNTTITISNPNPVGAKLNRLAFDVYYLDGSPILLGHGEKADIEVKESGNTSVIIPVTISNAQAVNAAGSLLRNGNITLYVNGSAFIDVKVTSFEKPFGQSREFQASEFSGLLPATIPGTDINLTEGIQQLGGLLGPVS
jgi:LEA14-like dessication related protein